MFKSLIAGGLVCASVAAASADVLSLLEPYYHGYLRDRTLCDDIDDVLVRSSNEGRWMSGKHPCADDAWFRLGDGTTDRDSLSDDAPLDPTLFDEQLSSHVSSPGIADLSHAILDGLDDPAELADAADNASAGFGAAWFSGTNDTDPHPGDSSIAHLRMAATEAGWWATGNPQAFSHQGERVSLQLTLPSLDLALSVNQELSDYRADIDAGESDGKSGQQAETALKYP